MEHVGSSYHVMSNGNNLRGRFSLVIDGSFAAGTACQLFEVGVRFFFVAKVCMCFPVLRTRSQMRHEGTLQSCRRNDLVESSAWVDWVPLVRRNSLYTCMVWLRSWWIDRVKNNVKSLLYKKSRSQFDIHRPTRLANWNATNCPLSMCAEVGIISMNPTTDFHYCFPPDALVEYGKPEHGVTYNLLDKRSVLVYSKLFVCFPSSFHQTVSRIIKFETILVHELDVTWCP